MLLCISSRFIFYKHAAIDLQAGGFACVAWTPRRISSFPVRQFFLFLFLSAVTSCSQPGKDADKDVYNNLELNGKINTFPLCIVLSDKLSGNDFPADIKELCSLSKQTCKTLPIAGLLRSGADIYYTYNCFADLKIPGTAEKDEAGITEAVEKQVSTYFSTTKPKQYDSLLTPNLPEWNIQNFPLMYVSNTSDSVFFYSNEPGFPSTIIVGERSYPVYKNVPRLRKDIDDIICKGYVKIAVFYNPVYGTTKSSAAETVIASRGKPAGDSCVQHAKYQKLHNGTGGFMLGKLLEANSTACGFAAATSLPTASSAKTASTPRADQRKVNSLPAQADQEGIDPPPAARTDNQSVRSSEPICEQDENKNYTGRRVRYIYNKQGKIARTIVISKCEADCRCF